jgi:hypothetical protein
MVAAIGVRSAGARDLAGARLPRNEHGLAIGAGRMKWLGIFAAIVVATGAVAIAFHEFTKAYTHLYRLTVAIEANGVEHVGSSVIEVA